MSKSNVKQATISGFFWRFAERCGAQGVTFFVSIILARILDLETYGTLALITVFITILQVFVDSGMGNALIQKKDADDLDFSSVFFFNIIFSVLLYLIMFFISPYIADFYHNADLTLVLRVLSITIIIAALKNVQQAYVSKNLMFKVFFFSTLGGTVGAAFVGVFMAYMGFGIWALVFQQIFNLLVDTMILWVKVKWRPKLLFSFERLKILLSFGWKLLLSSIIDTIYNNIQQLVIGKWYSPVALASFNQGNKFPAIIATNINASIDSILLPVLSNEQDNLSKIKSMTRRSIKTSSYMIFPLMIGMVVIAEPLVKIVLTEKWLPCVPYLRVFCLCFSFYPIFTANLNTFKALGRSDIYLKLEILKKFMGIIIFLISVPFGVFAIALSMLITTLVSLFINVIPSKNLFNYNIVEQIKDIFPPFIISCLMAIVVYPLTFFINNALALLISQIIFGMFVFITLSYIFRIEAFFYLIKYIFKRRIK
ncbi:lipopolysaccharide biosynthesis protein [Amedibacillus sp. YH-ame6]